MYKSSFTLPLVNFSLVVILMKRVSSLTYFPPSKSSSWEANLWEPMLSLALLLSGRWKHSGNLIYVESDNDHSSSFFYNKKNIFLFFYSFNIINFDEWFKSTSLVLVDWSRRVIVTLWEKGHERRASYSPGWISI